MIEIIVNGERKMIPEGLSVKEAIGALEYKTEGFALALNGTFVAINAYESTFIQANDRLEILSPVQGG
ncbi:MAG TPA: sulfur carrier protein ThiS [Sulfurovum sp.]|jgi:sulfur carrier protein|nr:MAG: thiamine biosynthesis protein ThiS [Sulfurovum sp. 35-42-20]OYZ25900.1 MAG: thiamine biosynthesis protein ThiS [Sulfurovum sp. 16-42-52]OYZ48745.1 MAG: thiamine biosynthesis protein ThiS [Sulfurovum sp. 24-42-9]OZA46789.1 MAG: thiamine biosynthesis protein ThiS [Sulfurovum sp. 17-42-90]OZA60013.1 MAG: thiamine biosynthesis protein ThiS [Sulfurovum sp. 39-42-12]HQR73501.1 sulfur carrier protein ThiS [Sulfurovum sp.]